MSKNDLKEILSPRDKGILSTNNGSSWVPNDPIDVLLPYINEKKVKPEENSIEDRRKKARDIYNGYEDIEKQANLLKEQIADRCKHVAVDVSPSEQTVVDAIKRVFGTDGTKITFQMYQRCISEMANRSEQSIPKPGDK